MLRTTDGGSTWNMDPGYNAPVGTVLMKLHVAPAFGFAIVVGRNGVAYKTTFDPISVGLHGSLIPDLDAGYDPVLEQLSIESPGNGTVELYDVLGRSILTVPADPGSTVIDCSSLTPGVYTVVAHGSSGTSTNKFLVH